jgi:hypothetical protein
MRARTIVLPAFLLPMFSAARKTPAGQQPPEEDNMKTTTKMKKIRVRRADDIRLTTAAICGKCYCAFV